jgi:hypothetical protein
MGNVPFNVTRAHKQYRPTALSIHNCAAVRATFREVDKRKMRATEEDHTAMRGTASIRRALQQRD